MKRFLLVVLLAGATALLAACGTGSGLTGKTWQLSAITTTTPAFQGVVPTAQQSLYTINFNSDGNFQARADCNQLAGTYTTSGSSLTILPGPMTLALCPEDSLSDEYVQALGNAQSYAIANNSLTITTDGGTLQFN